jgi:hypothetical protein
MNSQSVSRISLSFRTVWIKEALGQCTIASTPKIKKGV